MRNKNIFIVSSICYGKMSCKPHQFSSLQQEMQNQLTWISNTAIYHIVSSSRHWKRWLTLNYIKWHWVTLFFKLFCFKFFLLLSSDNKIYLKICRWCVFRRWDFLFDFILIENVKNITKTMHTNGFSTLISLNCILLELYVYMMRCYIIHTHSGCTCFKMYELIDLDFPS